MRNMDGISILPNISSSNRFFFNINERSGGKYQSRPKKQNRSTNSRKYRVPFWMETNLQENKGTIGNSSKREECLPSHPLPREKTFYTQIK
jgi:hypothetical protein